jgi:hypothetical protein
MRVFLTPSSTLVVGLIIGYYFGFSNTTHKWQEDISSLGELSKSISSQKFNPHNISSNLLYSSASNNHLNFYMGLMQETDVSIEFIEGSIHYVGPPK